MLSRKGILVVLIVTVELLTLMPVLAIQQRDALNNDRVHRVIEQIWSSQETERQDAKQALINIGPEAIEPLIMLLKDIIRNPYRRYMIGKEMEVEQAIEDYNRLLAQNKSKKAKEALNQLSKWEISIRLKLDAIDLLINLQAKEAVPVLIELMLHDLSIAGLGRERWRDGMQSLKRLG